jgi:transcriptional regulator with XRE-family HTH domain
MKKLHAHIRTTLKRLLRQRGISAEKLAYEVGVSKGFIYGYLKGDAKHGNISLNVLAKLAEGLEVEVKDLLP